MAMLHALTRDRVNTPVTDDYKERENKFTGKIHKVTIEVAPVKMGAADRDELWKALAAIKAAE